MAFRQDAPLGCEVSNEGSHITAAGEELKEGPGIERMQSNLLETHLAGNLLIRD